MRWLAGLLLALPLRAGPDDVVRGEPFRFEIEKPDSLDWEIVKPAKENVKAHLRSAWDGGAVDVFLIVTRTQGSLAELARRWQAAYGAGKARKGKLGGRPAIVTEAGAVTWILARDRDRAYGLFISRAGNAVGDEAVAAEIEEIRASLRLLGPPAAEEDRQEDAGPARNEAGPGLEAREIHLRFWRVRFLKPGGFKEVPATAFTKADRDAGQVFRCERGREQTRCVIRVFAFRKGQRFRRPLDKVAQDRLDRFAKTYATRLEPERKNRWRIPLVKTGITLRLTGKRRVPETSLWYLAECRNGVQYQVHVDLAGAHGENAWAAPVQAFLDSFRPVFDSSRIADPPRHLGVSEKPP